MTKTNTVAEEYSFEDYCRVINLKYEYPGYSDSVPWAIVSEMTEAELRTRFPEVIGSFSPFILLSPDEGEAMRIYDRQEDRYRKECLRHGVFFEFNSEILPEEMLFSTDEDPYELIVKNEEQERIIQTLAVLTETQRRRIMLRFFEDMNLREIAAIEGVAHQDVDKSIKAGIKKLKKEIEL